MFHVLRGGGGRGGGGHVSRFLWKVLQVETDSSGLDTKLSLSPSLYPSPVNHGGGQETTPLFPPSPRSTRWPFLRRRRGINPARISATFTTGPRRFRAASCKIRPPPSHFKFFSPFFSLLFSPCSSFSTIYFNTFLAFFSAPSPSPPSLCCLTIVRPHASFPPSIDERKRGKKINKSQTDRTIPVVEKSWLPRENCYPFR